MPGIPLLAPLYPDPPYEYRGSRLAVATLEAAPGFEMPEGFEPVEPIGAVAVFADYPETTIGPYFEVVVLAPCTYGGEFGLYCPFIYVDTDDAMAAGREVWGFPKKIASIALAFDGDAVTARLERRGEELLVLEGSTPDELDPEVAGALAALPIFNRKVIPGPAAKEPDVESVTKVVLEATGHGAWSGTGTLRAAGELSAVFGSGGAVGISRSVVDSVLPPGERVR